MTIHAEPLSSALPNDPYYATEFVVLKQENCSYLAIERAWTVLRDYSPNDWRSVIADLKRGEQTGRWFGK
jgi:hypothetical protein